MRLNVDSWKKRAGFGLRVIERGRSPEVPGRLKEVLAIFERLNGEFEIMLRACASVPEELLHLQDLIYAQYARIELDTRVLVKQHELPLPWKPAGVSQFNAHVGFEDMVHVAHAVLLAVPSPDDERWRGCEANVSRLGELLEHRKEWADGFVKVSAGFPEVNFEHQRWLSRVRVFADREDPSSAHTWRRHLFAGERMPEWD
ncbi:MAG: hypothetical protein JNG84_04530 [Archangium sp.]|nr:hypothetical protein [Archangium sp.]